MKYTNLTVSLLSYQACVSSLLKSDSELKLNIFSTPASVITAESVVSKTPDIKNNNSTNIVTTILTSKYWALGTSTVQLYCVHSVQMYSGISQQTLELSKHCCGGGQTCWGCYVIAVFCNDYIYQLHVVIITLLISSCSNPSHKTSVCGG